MGEKMQIESITYERERLDFFTELMKLAQTRYNLLHRRFKDAPYLSEEHQTLSDMGREIHFFGDVVEMLEKGYRKQSEPISCNHEKGVWISVDERLPESLQRVLAINTRGDMFTSVYISFSTGKNAWSTPYSYLGDITHWMPLPEPPMMKEGAE